MRPFGLAHGRLCPETTSLSRLSKLIAICSTDTTLACHSSLVVFTKLGYPECAPTPLHQPSMADAIALVIGILCA